MAPKAQDLEDLVHFSATSEIKSLADRIQPFPRPSQRQDVPAQCPWKDQEVFLMTCDDGVGGGVGAAGTVLPPEEGRAASSRGGGKEEHPPGGERGASSGGCPRRGERGASSQGEKRSILPGSARGAGGGGEEEHPREGPRCQGAHTVPGVPGGPRHCATGGNACVR